MYVCIVSDWSTEPFTSMLLWEPRKYLLSSFVIYSGTESGWQIFYVFLALSYIYLHNKPLQPFGYDYGLASHTTHVECANFIRDCWDLQFNVNSERQIFEQIFHYRPIYSQNLCRKSAEKKSTKKCFFSYFVLMADLGYEPGLDV